MLVSSQRNTSSSIQSYNTHGKSTPNIKEVFISSTYVQFSDEIKVS
jgi:hypothetical protein